MRLSSPIVASHTPNASEVDTKRSASSRIPKPWRRSPTSASSACKKHDSNKRLPASQVGRQASVLVRKKLPWLDGPQQSKPGQVPGYYGDSKESLKQVGDAHDSPPPVPEKDSPPPPVHRPSVSSVGGDPALRAVGSTPSLRKRAKSGEFKTLSLNSHLRTGIKPAASREDAKQALGMVDEGPQAANYASSEYSATPSSDKDQMPAELPKRDPSSYERLVDRRRRSTFDPETRGQYLAKSEFLQSQLDLSLETPEPSPRQILKSSTSRISPREHMQTHGSHPSSESCRSCEQSPHLREMPKARTLPRHSVASVPPKPAQMTKAKTFSRQSVVPLPYEPPRPPAPIRKSTIFAMPSHLLPSSSSSSHRDTPPRVPTTRLSVPQPPPPVASTGEVKRQSVTLNRAVTGLENLMEEALTVARNAAENGRNDDVAQILDNATLALRKASTVHGQMNAGRRNQPLVLSPPESARNSESGSAEHYSDASSMHSMRHSIDTAPTLFTKSAQSSRQPILTDRYKPGGRTPTSEKLVLEESDVRPRRGSSGDHSISHTPPRLYQPPSADSIVRDFAYAKAMNAKAEAARHLSRSYGAAADYSEDTGQSVGTQPGIRPSVSAPTITDKPLPELPGRAQRSSWDPPYGNRQTQAVHRIEQVPTDTVPPRRSSRSWEKLTDPEEGPRHRIRARHQRPHLSNMFTSSYYHEPTKENKAADGGPINTGELNRGPSTVTDTRYDKPELENRGSLSKSIARYSDLAPMLRRDISLRHPRRKHISLKECQGFSLGRYHRRQPIAREWNTHRKRITATIACMNTVFFGLIAGIYVSRPFCA